MKKKPFIDVKTIMTTAVGGVLLLFASFVVNVFFSTPPTRAEFDSYKAETSSQYRSINNRLKTLKNGQGKIIDHLLNNKGKK